MRLPDAATVVCAVATAPERRFLLQHGIDCAQTGVGPPRAEQWAAQIVKLNPAGILCVGTAAGLQTQLSAGTLLLPRQIDLPDGSHVDVDAAWHAHVHRVIGAQMNCSDGNLLLTDHVLHTIGAKAEARDRTGAVAADMESGAIGSVAARARIPLLVLRVVADSASQPVSPGVVAALRPNGEVDLVALLGWLATHPGEFSALLRLRGSFRLAMATLAQALAIARHIRPPQTKN